MKGIGIFVAVLLVAGGVAMYLYTRPPDRRLDLQGSTWVKTFEAWSADMSRSIDRAETSIGVSRGETLDPELLPPLEACATSLAKLGPPPILLDRALEEGNIACAEIERALSVYRAYGPPALASTELHLKRAARWLQAANLTIERRLTGKE